MRYRSGRTGPALGAALVLLALALSPAAAQAQASADRMAELRHRRDLRDAQQAGDPEKIAARARGYLENFPRGRYRDEALVALARALQRTGRTAEALDTYGRLIDNHPDSPFREQALADSLPLMQAVGDEAGAFARLERLLDEYPRSVMRGQALLWRARIHLDREQYPEAVKTLQRLDPGRELSGPAATEHYRMLTIALTRSGQPAWQPLQRYLRRPGEARDKAEVLMLVAETAREAGRGAEAFGHYRRVAEDYPHPAYLPEALFWQAELFARTKLPAPDEARRAAGLETAIGYYSAYLAHGDQTHAGRAHLGRARLLREAGRKAEALEDYDRAIDLEPALGTKLETLQARIALNKALGRREPARALIETLRRREDLSPAQRSALLLELAALHYEDRQCEEVEALLQPMPAIDDEAQRRRATFMRGFCRHLSGDWERAAFDLERLVNHPDYQSLVLPPLLTVYEQSGQPSRLVKLVETLLRQDRLEPSREVFVRVADAYGELGEWSRVKALHRRLADRDPGTMDHPAVILRLGRAERALGETEAAVARQEAAWARLIDAGEGEPELVLAVLGELQSLYRAQKRFGDAQALHEQAGALLPGEQARARAAALRRELWIAWGRHAVREGDSALALEKLEAARESLPDAGGEGRQRVVAVMIAAHLKSDHPDHALSLYKEETEGRPALREGITLAALEEAESLAAHRPGPERRGPVIAFYRRALANLPERHGARRYQVLLVLDRLYAEAGDYPARIDLVAGFRQQTPQGETAKALRLHQSRVHREWGRRLMKEKKHAAAARQFRASLEVLRPAEWRERYEAISLVSRAYLAHKRYTELVLLNEKELPNLDDEKLAGQVRHFLGQVYLDWGKAADKRENLKSARIRYHRALDYLPDSDWQRRLAAANGLAATFRKLERPRDAAQILEAVVPQIQNDLQAQQYALYLGRLYLQTLHDADKAREWLQRADRGGNDALSLESGYLLSGQEIEAGRIEAAVSRLKTLAARDLGGSDWEVPIHYRLAVLLHRRKDLKGALRHYRIVARVDDPKIKRIYPRSIGQSAKKARQIQSYLDSPAGRQAGEVSVPKIR